MAPATTNPPHRRRGCAFCCIKKLQGTGYAQSSRPAGSDLDNRLLRLFRYGRGECENRWMNEHIKVAGPTVARAS